VRNFLKLNRGLVSSQLDWKGSGFAAEAWAANESFFQSLLMIRLLSENYIGQLSARNANPLANQTATMPPFHPAIEAAEENIKCI